MGKIGNYTHGKLEHTIRLFIEKHLAASQEHEPADPPLGGGGGSGGGGITQNTTTYEGNTYKISLQCATGEEEEFVIEDGKELTIVNDVEAIFIPCADTPDLLGVSEILAGDAIRIDNATEPQPEVNVQFHDLSDPDGGAASNDLILIYDVDGDSATTGQLRKTTIGSLISTTSGSPASLDEPYITHAASGNLTNERVLTATDTTGLKKDDAGTNGGAFTLSIDIHGATEVSGKTAPISDDYLLIADSEDNNATKKVKFGSSLGDVKAGASDSTYGIDNFTTTAVQNLMMVSHSDAKTIKYPDGRITTNRESLAVEGILTIANSTSGTTSGDRLKIIPDPSDEGTIVKLDFQKKGHFKYKDASRFTVSRFATRIAPITVRGGLLFESSDNGAGAGMVYSIPDSDSTDATQAIARITVDASEVSTSAPFDTLTLVATVGTEVELTLATAASAGGTASSTSLFLSSNIDASGTDNAAAILIKTAIDNSAYFTAAIEGDPDNLITVTQAVAGFAGNSGIDTTSSGLTIANASYFAGGSDDLPGNYSSGALIIRNQATSVQAPVLLLNNSGMRDGIHLKSYGGTPSSLTLETDAGTGDHAIQLKAQSGGLSIDVGKGVYLASKTTQPTAAGGYTNKLSNYNGSLYWGELIVSLGATNITAEDPAQYRIGVFDDVSSSPVELKGYSGLTYSGTSGTFSATAATSKLISSAITLGAEADVTLTFEGDQTDGVFKWMGDTGADYFRFDDDVRFNSSQKLFFNDANHYIFYRDTTPQENTLVITSNDNYVNDSDGTVDTGNDLIDLVATRVNTRSAFRNIVELGSSTTSIVEYFSSGLLAPASGESIRYINQLSLTKGALYYLTSAGAWAKADASDDSKGAKTLLTVALDAGSRFKSVSINTTNQSEGMLLRGIVSTTQYEGTVVVGAALYMSETAGKFTFDQPTDSNEVVRVVGHCLGHNSSPTNTIVVYFNPSADWIERA